MDKVKSIKNGYIEGVVFCFYKEGRLLIEDRGKGFGKEAFFPNGTIENQDKLYGNNYIENALYREVSEEFRQQIKILEKHFLGELEVPAINVLYYIYIITDWQGDFPLTIKEDEEPESNLSFFMIEELKKLFKYESAFDILERINSFIDYKNNKKHW